MKEQAYFDARAWLVWLLSAAAVTMLTRNPLYTLLLLLVSRVVDDSCAADDSELQLPLGRLAVVILLFSGGFNALFVNQGATVLARLPAAWPLIGGPITLEGVAYGLETGLILLALLSFFLAFNRIVPVSALARLAPRAFQDLGVVLLIALTYVPETARNVQRIREAQAVRGHRLKSMWDWRPLMVPLLVGSLERAMMLAEAMVARGFGATRERQQSARALAGLAGGLGLVLAGWVTALWWGAIGWAIAAGGVALLLFQVWQNGRRVEATRHRAEPWSLWDTLLIIASLIPLAMLLLLPLLTGQEVGSYSPYPRLQLPPFHPLLGTSFLLFVMPAIVVSLLFTSPSKESVHDHR
ncbi:MAG TPA: energy-coupling factor transporter transmembrane component T [Candidatus Sulfomarinibacteraceae bacterium]|nr:energy-coupling factor transporter transmembrane component T [Candidatus Sulfomarinibacteraceae bacterium]